MTKYTYFKLVFDRNWPSTSAWQALTGGLT